MWRKGKPYALLMGVQTGAATVENCMEVPWKIKNRTAIWSNNSISEYFRLSQENEKSNSKRYMHSLVHWNIIYNSQDMETT